ncbi:MAG: penicillin-binding transpeptidase domain-containing protein [Ktedonobacterales bacterium]
MREDMSGATGANEPSSDVTDMPTQQVGPAAGATPTKPRFTSQIGPDGRSMPAGLDEEELPRTQQLPPGFYPSGAQLARSAKTPQQLQRRNRRLGATLSIVLIIALLAGGAYYLYPLFHNGQSILNINGCAKGTPCQVANAYLNDFSSGNYEAMYALTSNASRQRFSDKHILRGDFKDAHDYIVTRTSSILAEAQIVDILTTPGAAQKVDDTHVTVPVREVLTSARVGDIAQDITIPLVDEQGHWHVDWSPGLIFAQLDDANDPTYTRKVHLYTASGLRGTIFDRDGNVLAKDETVYVVGVVPSKITNAAQVSSVLSVNLDLTPAQVTAAYAGAPTNQFAAIRTITPMLYASISGALNAVAGVQAQTTTGRVYPFGQDLAPVTGYLGQVSPDDIKNDTSHYYVSGDVIGRAGIEAWGEQYLRPGKGGSLVIAATNADGTLGQAIYTLATRAAGNGADIHTTIALALQQAAMASLRKQSGHSGGTVALDPTTGEVLTLGSNPTYDPNDFSLGITQNELARLNAEDHPYVNRAYATADPIGSNFKLVTLSAGLQNGVTPAQIFTCTGLYQVPGAASVSHDDAPLGHGNLTAPDALGPSCDVVFWKIAVLLNSKDPNLLPNVAKAFGYGAPTGMIGLPVGAENPGLVPDPQWLQQHENGQWTATDAANLGIGQGFFQATPAQVAMATAAIANNGVRMQARLVSSVTAASGATLITFPAKQIGMLPLSADNLSVLQVAMLGPIYDPNGTTSAEFRNYPITVAGKTGTAESGQPLPHAWFSVYAPVAKLSGPPVKPQIAIGTLVEYSASGERFAVPVSKAILNAFFHLPPSD